MIMTNTPRHAGAQWTYLALMVLVLAGCTTPRVAVPGVIGETVPDAVTTLEAAGFTVGYDGPAPDEGIADRWFVTMQEPTATDDDQEKGSEVTLWVASVLEKAAQACAPSAEIGDAGKSLVLDMEGQDNGSGVLPQTQVFCVLDRLEMPDSVRAKMESTRALDGSQSADWDGIEATWSYHPDDGLDVILELQG
jgi:hypothetical protein